MSDNHRRRSVFVGHTPTTTERYGHLKWAYIYVYVYYAMCWVREPYNDPIYRYVTGTLDYRYLNTVLYKI